MRKFLLLNSEKKIVDIGFPKENLTKLNQPGLELVLSDRDDLLVGDTYYNEGSVDKDISDGSLRDKETKRGSRKRELKKSIRTKMIALGFTEEEIYLLGI